MTITGTKWFIAYRKYVHRSSGWLEWAGMLALVLMMVTALLDVVGTKALHRPLPGSTEISSVLQVLAVAGGMAYSKIDGRHIRVDFIVDKLSRHTQAILEILISFLVLGFFIVATVMTFRYGLSIQASGTETLLIGIPLYPFAFFISLFCLAMNFVVIGEMLNAIDKARN